MITNSKFYMWRSIFALSHADLVVTPEELSFMHKTLEQLDLSEPQYEVLKHDIKEPQDALDMFHGITDPEDRKEFFHIAYDIVWVDGEQNQDEENMLARLKKDYKENNPGAGADLSPYAEVEIAFAEKPPHKDEGLQRLLDELKASREGK